MYSSNQIYAGSIVWVASLLLWTDGKSLYKHRYTQGIFKGVVIEDLSEYGYRGPCVGYQHLQKLGLKNWENFFQPNPYNIFPLHTSRDVLLEKIDCGSKQDYLRSIKNTDYQKMYDQYNLWLSEIPKPFFSSKKQKSNTKWLHFLADVPDSEGLAIKLTSLLTGKDPNQEIEQTSKSCENYFIDLPRDVQVRINGYYEKLKNDTTRL